MARLSNYKGPLTFQSNFEEMWKHPSSINRVDPKMQKNLVVFLGLVVSALAGALPFKFKLGGPWHQMSTLKQWSVMQEKQRIFSDFTSALLDDFFHISVCASSRMWGWDKKMKLVNCHFRGLHNVLPIVQKQREAEKIHTPNLFYKGLTSWKIIVQRLNHTNENRL